MQLVKLCLSFRIYEIKSKILNNVINISIPLLVKWHVNMLTKWWRAGDVRVEPILIT